MNNILLFLLYVTIPVKILSPCDYDSKDPYSTANFIIKCINENDYKNFVCAQNKVLKAKMDTDLKAQKKLNHLKSEWNPECGNTLEGIKEIRIRKKEGKDLYYCKFYEKETTLEYTDMDGKKIIEKELKVFVITLSIEDNDYKFEDINSPSKKTFEKLELYKANAK